MKDGKNRKGMKVTVRTYKRRLTYISVALTITIIVVIVVSGFIIYHSSRPRPKAAIVDQLSIFTPNQTFVDTSKSILEKAMFSVDYYEGSLVTVEFYKRLPTLGYRLIVLRVHSTTHEPEAGVQHTGLFTSEPYDSTKYSNLRNTLQVGVVAFLPYQEGDPVYFGITSRFVELSMVGMFEKTTIIMMGCWGLTYPDLAEAFVAKGAHVYIGWSDFVLSSHTDAATILLLRHLVSQEQTVEQAVNETMKEIGPDPESHGVLSYYPEGQDDALLYITLGKLCRRTPFSLLNVLKKEEMCAYICILGSGTRKQEIMFVVEDRVVH